MENSGLTAEYRLSSMDRMGKSEFKEYPLSWWKHIQCQFWCDWYIFKSGWLYVVIGIFLQWIHNSATNIVYYIYSVKTHGKGEKILYDVGFDLFPEPSDSIKIIPSLLLFASNVLVVPVFFAPYFVIFYKQVWNNNGYQPYYFMDLLLRIAIICGVMYLLRSITFLLTNLPAPSPHCGPDKTINPPSGLNLWFGFNPEDGCGDLIFSGHTSLCLLCLMFQYYYSQIYLFANKPLCWKIYFYGLIIPLFISMSIMIIVVRNHYSVDVWVAWYTVPLLFYWFYHKIPSKNWNIDPEIIKIKKYYGIIITKNANDKFNDSQLISEIDAQMQINNSNENE